MNMTERGTNSEATLETCRGSPREGREGNIEVAMRVAAIYPQPHVVRVMTGTTLLLLLKDLRKTLIERNQEDFPRKSNVSYSFIVACSLLHKDYVYL